jgi:hypothetical protein
MLQKSSFAADTNPTRLELSKVHKMKGHDNRLHGVSYADNEQLGR